MPSSSPKPGVRRKRVDQSLQYRWGIVGIVLAVGFFSWYLFTSGESRQPTRSEATRNQEKIICPRCGNDPEKKLNCSLCGGLGQIWVNKDVDPGRRPAPQP